jgi:hypothetical protein
MRTKEVCGAEKGDFGTHADVREIASRANAPLADVREMATGG